MDSSDWLQGTITYENNGGIDLSSSPSSGQALDMLTCTMGGEHSQAIMDQRRLKPPHDQALNCPRCDSTHTKFCYYNNYSLTQPRYFCKTCRRYWTKGGTLRNIPVGGGCRKNKRINPNKKINQNLPDYRVSEMNSLLGCQGSRGVGGLGLLGNQETTQVTMPNDNFMECSRNNFEVVSSTSHRLGINFNGICSSFGYPYEDVLNMNNSGYEHIMDVKSSNAKLLTLDNWQDHHHNFNSEDFTFFINQV